MYNRLLLKATLLTVVVVVLLITSCNTIGSSARVRQERKYWQWVQEHDSEYYEYVVDSLIKRL